MRVKQSTTVLLLLVLLILLLDLRSTSGKWCTQQQKQRIVQRLYKANTKTINDEAEKQNANNIEPAEDGRFCCPGYYLKDEECISFCKEPCTNGYCKEETGECICLNGYTQNNVTKECVAAATVIGGDGQDKCLNASHNCDCQTGYEFNKASKQCKPVCQSKCSSAAQDDNDNLMCQRICLKKCRTGKCFNPSVGRQNIISNTSCSSNCGFGECLEPGGLCQCHQGYVLSNHSLLCEPWCSLKCPTNSKCVLPNVCECDKGFVLDPTTRNRCKSLDSKEFLYARSLSQSAEPLTLDKINKILYNCEKGYHYDETLRQCQPSCHNDCLNGNCISPDVCICYSGYSMDMTSLSCQPNTCKTTCPQGYCTPDGDCICPKGLTKALTRGSGCEPIFYHNIKVFGIFLCVMTILIMIIWLIALAERRRRRRFM